MRAESVNAEFLCSLCTAGGLLFRPLRTRVSRREFSLPKGLSANHIELAAHV
jgi:hypothetical protein